MGGVEYSLFIFDCLSTPFVQNAVKVGENGRKIDLRLYFFIIPLVE
jgi:hypothetical protein